MIFETRILHCSDSSLYASDISFLNSDLFIKVFGWCKECQLHFNFAIEISVISFRILLQYQ